jgi:hypothetical protein
LRNGLRRFPQGFSCPAVLRYRLRVLIVFAYVAITRSGAAFQRASTNDRFGNSTVAGPTTPTALNTQPGQLSLFFETGGIRKNSFFLAACRLPDLIACRVQKVWAISDFARHYFRNRVCFLFLQVLRWFTSLGSLLFTYVFSEGYAGFTSVGFPIRKSPDQCLLAAPRGLSQLATSFFAFFCQGIHRAPLVA